MQNKENSRKYVRFILPSLNLQEFNQKLQDFSKILDLSGIGVFDDEFRLIFCAGLDRAFFEALPRELIRLQGEDHTWNLLQYAGLFGLFKHYNFEDGRIYTALLFFSKEPTIISGFLDYFCESIVREVILYRSVKNEFERTISGLEKLYKGNTIIASSEVFISGGYKRKGASDGATEFSPCLLKGEVVDKVKWLTAINYFQRKYVEFARVSFLGESYYVFGSFNRHISTCLIKYDFVKKLKAETERAKRGKIVRISTIAVEPWRKAYTVNFYMKPSRGLPEEWKRIFSVSGDKISESLIKSLQPILSIVKSKDLHTYLHLKNVARLSGIIAYEMGLDENELVYVQLAGLVHDIGKIVLPLELITKPQALGEMEMEMIKLHVKYSCDIVRDLDFLEGTLNYIRQHHERLDGSGYPDALKGSEISSASHAVIMADILDAMSSDRPYRRKRTFAEIEEEIEIGKNVKYDPKAVDIALKLLHNGLVVLPD
ncbi:MAG: HD domain-containing protein [bacterium]|nr:HD domain-containing protein [bacterium]